MGGSPSAREPFASPFGWLGRTGGEAPRTLWATGRRCHAQGDGGVAATLGAAVMDRRYNFKGYNFEPQARRYAGEVFNNSVSIRPARRDPWFDLSAAPAGLMIFRIVFPRLKPWAIFGAPLRGCGWNVAELPPCRANFSRHCLVGKCGRAARRRGHSGRRGVAATLRATRASLPRWGATVMDRRYGEPGFCGRAKQDSMAPQVVHSRQRIQPDTLTA